MIKQTHSSWLALLLLSLITVACTSSPQAVANSPAQPVATETMPPTAEITPTTTATTQATATSAPTIAPPATATALPTITPTASATPIPTIELDATPAGLPCPAETPLKPVYDRYYLSAQAWPTPAPAYPSDHFWMAKPLPGGGRFLTNQGFPYGYDQGGRLLIHTGVDSAEDLATPLLAVADGTIVVARPDVAEQYGWRCDWYGQLVVLELDQRWNDQPVYALYGHVLNIVVQEGQHVERGQQVAEIGFGGAATAPHLHFEVRVGENSFASTRNPLLWFQPPPSRGLLAGRLVDPQGRPWQGVALALVPADSEQETIGTWSYLGDPDGLANPDEAIAENFLFSDVRPGEYELYTEVQGISYSQPVTIYGGDLHTIELVTHAFVPITPSAEPETDQNVTETATETPISAEIAPDATPEVTPTVTNSSENE